MDFRCMTFAGALALLGAAAVPTPSLALDAGDILVRVRGIGVLPTGSSGGIAPDLPTASLDPQPMGVPEIDFTYMITPNIGIEVIAATTPHDVNGAGAISSLNKVGDTWLLPPTALVQWHFLPQGRIRPYIGAGINYTVTYGEDASSSLAGALGGPTRLELSNSVGWAVQGGVDIAITDRWFANIDVKYIDIDVDATITTGAVTRTTRVPIDPVVVGVGIGYRF
ncbi:MAG: OmpW family protein [Rhodospirillales bacterium]